MASPRARAVRTVVAWALVVPCLAWTLVRVLGIDLGYPLAPAMSYTPYVVPVAAFACALAALLRCWVAAAAAATAVLVLVALIAPRAIGGPDEETEGRALRLMSANVFRGEADAETLLRQAREHDVDVLAVQELTPEFASELGRLGIASELPNSVLKLREGVSGNGLYSRYPLTHVPSEQPGIHQLRTRLDLGRGRGLEVVSVHPEAPHGSDTVDQWEHDLDALPEATPDESMRLLIGDFNATFDHPQFRDLVGSGYQDAAEQLGDGLVPTWPNGDKPLRYLPVTIDHLLYDERIGARDYEVLDLPESDHRPVYAELVVPDPAAG